MKRTRFKFNVAALSDGDASTASGLVSGHRARVSVGEVEAQFRADTVLAFVAAQGDLSAELSVLAEASAYDAAHPGEPSLVEEMCAAVEGDDPGLAVAA